MESENTKAGTGQEIINAQSSLIERAFIRRVLIVIGLVALFGLIAIGLWQGSDAILLVFAGLLLAIFLRSLSGFISRYTPLSHTLALTGVLLLVVGLIALGVWLLAPSMQKQFQELSEQLPAAFQAARGRISEFPFGQQILDQLPNPQQLNQRQSSNNVFERVTGFFSSALGTIANVLIVLIVGIYFAFNPKLYETGLIKLVPKRAERRAREIIETIGKILRGFLLGISCSMMINGTLTFVGLWGDF